MRLFNNRLIETVRYFEQYFQQQTHEAVWLLKRKWSGEIVRGTAESKGEYVESYRDEKNPLREVRRVFYVFEINYGSRYGRPRLNTLRVWDGERELERVHSMDQLGQGRFAVQVDLGGRLPEDEGRVYILLSEQPTSSIVYSYEEVCKCVAPENEFEFRPQLGECPICYGTGFVGGFDLFRREPLYEGDDLICPRDMILIRTPIAAHKVVVDQFGIEIREVYNSWTGPEPVLRDWDVVVRPSPLGERHAVASSKKTFYWITDHQFSTARFDEWGRPIVLHQKFTLNIIQPSNVIYDFPLEEA